MRHITLVVAGMHCRRCVREVTARLRDVPGVETVSANSGDGLVRLFGQMALTDVLGAFTGTTFRPEVHRDGDVNSGGTAAGQPAP